MSGLNPCKSLCSDFKIDRLRAPLKYSVLVIFIVSGLLVIYSAFISDPTRMIGSTRPECDKIRPGNPNRNSIDPGSTNVSHVLFGIGGSIETWKTRRQYSELWWDPNTTRGFVWLDSEPDPNQPWPESSPPYRISSEWRRFKHTHSNSAVRLARIVVDAFRVKAPGVRWFVMGDDDTVFFPENLVAVLGKYDHREMFYVGGNSESVEQDAMHAFDMAFGGGGFAVSYPLAAELVKIFDGCLDRYFYFYGSDQRVWACIGELGVSLTRELGFHQIDIRGDPFGLLAAHPVAPLVSLHHLDDVNPLFPNKTQLDSLRTIVEAYKANPAQIMQQTFCYWRRKWSISVSWGYLVQIYPSILTPKELEMPLQTFQTWRSWSNGPFTFNTRPVNPDPCQRPVVFYLDSIEMAKNGEIVTTYKKFSDETRKKCHWLNYGHADGIEKVVVSAPIMDSEEWKHVPRRRCCEVSKGFWSSTMNVEIRRCRHREALIPGG